MTTPPGPSAHDATVSGAFRCCGLLATLVVLCILAQAVYAQNDDCIAGITFGSMYENQANAGQWPGNRVNALVFLIRFRDDFRTASYVSCWEPTSDITSPPPFADQLIEPWQATPDPTTFRPHTLTDYLYQQSRTNPQNPVYLFGDVYPRVGGQPIVYETLYNESYYRGAGGIPEVLAEILNSLDDDVIDFSEYDQNGDGYFDQIIMNFRSTLRGDGTVAAANGEVGLWGLSLMARDSRPVPVIVKDGISVDWNRSGQTNAIMNLCFNPQNSYTVRQARPVVQNMAHEIIHQFMFRDGVLLMNPNSHLGTFLDNSIPINASIPNASCNPRCDNLYTFSVMGGFRYNYTANSTLTLAGQERVMLGYSTPTLLLNNMTGILVRDLYTTGDIYRMQSGYMPGGTQRYINIVNRQNIGFFDELQAFDYPGRPSTEYQGQLGTGIVAELVAPGFSAAYDVITPDGTVSQSTRVSDYVGDTFKPGVQTQLTPWTRPNINGCLGYGTAGASRPEICAESTFLPSFSAVTNIRYAIGSSTDMRLDYVADIRQESVFVITANSWWGPESDDEIFNSIVVAPGATLTVETGTEITLMGNLTVQSGGELDLRGTLTFGPAAGLVVWGEMEATDGVMTALDPTLGWRGVRIEQNPFVDSNGAPGVGPVMWTNTTVSEVSTPDGSLTTPAAVVVFDRHLSMVGGAIENTENGSGLYVASGSAWVSNGVEIQDNDGHGLETGAGGSIVAFEDVNPVAVTITGNGDGGVSAAGQGGTITLARAVITDNDGVGIEARANGTVNLSATERVTVTENQGGLFARGGGDLFAGACSLVGGQTVCTAPTIGHFFDDNTPSGAYYDARSITGAVLYAEGNDWGTDDPSPSNLILISDAQSFISVCPFVGGTAGTCAASGRVAGPVFGQRTTSEGTRGASVSAPLFALASSLLAEGDTLAAVAAVTGALDGATTEDERVGAYQAAARIAALVQPPAFVARLAAESEPEADPSTRPWALRALVAAQTSASDAAAAHGSASALINGYAGTEHEAEGWSARVLLAVAADDETAALAAYDALAPLDSMGAAVAGDFIAAAFAGDGDDARYAGGPAGGVDTLAPEATSQTAGLPAVVEVGRVTPNPASGSAALMVGLPVSSGVAVDVYDALGRQVWSSAMTEQAAGYHRVIMEAGALAPGVYVARVRVSAPGEAPRVESRRFVVVR